MFSGELITRSTTSYNLSGWSNLKPKQTVPFLLSSHGLGMWAMMDYYGEAWMGWRKSVVVEHLLLPDNLDLILMPSFVPQQPWSSRAATSTSPGFQELPRGGIERTS